MHWCDRIVYDLGAAMQQAVNRAADRFFVAGDGMRRQHDRVAFFQAEETVCAGGEPSYDG